MDFQAFIDNGDRTGLYETFDNARIYRDSFINASSGPIKRSYRIYVDIADRAGSLAKITGQMAEQNISIKNIGITHNRESEDGVLKIEFYEEAAMINAGELLKKIGYSVSIRS